MPDKSWRTLESSLLLSAAPWLHVFKERVQLPDGRVLDDFYRVVSPDFVTIAAVTPAMELVLLRGYKHGAGRVSLSCPGGFLEPGESPLRAAQRELAEETGYTAQEWMAMGSFVMDGNRHSCTAHLYLAHGAVPAGAITSNDVEDEEVELLPVKRVQEALAAGEIMLLPTLATVTLAMMYGVRP